MLKKTFIPLAIVACLIALLAYFFSGDALPPTYDLEPSVAEVPPPAEKWLDPEAPATEADPGPIVDLGEGKAAISGQVIESEGGAAPGARVALLRSKLPAAIEQEGGVSMWSVVDFGSVFSTSADLSGQMPLRSDLLEGLSVLARATADESGNYSFTGVPSGRFVIAAQQPGSLITPSPTVLYLEEENVEVDVRLVQAARLVGSVRSERGDAIHEAKVLLRGRVFDTSSGMEGLYLGRDDLLTFLLNPIYRVTESDLSGNFSVEVLPMLEYDVFVVAEPWAQADDRVYLPEDQRLDITLNEGAVIEGVVRGVDGQVVGGAEIQVQQEAGFGRMVSFRRIPLPSTTSESNGYFRITGLPEGTFDLRTAAAGYFDNHTRNVEATFGDRQQVEITLEPGHTISGRVIDAQGHPLEGIEISSRPDTGGGFGGFGGGRGRNTSRTTSASDGTFLLESLTDDRQRLSFEGEDWFEKSERHPVDGPAIEVTLDPAVVFTGTVIEAEGSPLYRAIVEAARWGRSSDRAETERDGSFKLSLHSESSSLTIRARGFQRLEVEVPETGGDLGELILTPAVTISGRVVDPDGVPLAGARVTAQFSRDDPFSSFRGDTGGQDSRRGRGDGNVSDRGRRDQGGGRDNSTRGRGSRGGFDQGASGRGRGNSDRSRGGAFFRAMSERVTAWSDSSGNYLLELSEPIATYELTASFPMLLASSPVVIEVVAEPVEGVDLVVRWGALVRGTVVGPAGPIDRATVSLRTENRSRRGGFGGGRTATTSRDGSFLIPGLSAATYSLRTSANGYGDARIEDLVLAESEERFLTIRLEEAQRLEGVVIDSGGFIIAGASVSARDTSGAWRRGSSAVDGSFSIDGLAPGPVRLRARASGYLDKDIRDLDPSFGAIEVVLEASHSLRGVVIDAETGEPIRRASVRAESSSESASQRGGGRSSRNRGDSDRTNEDGEFELRGLLEGDWQVAVRADGFISQDVGLFSLPLDDPNTYLIVEMQPGARIIGVVVDGAGVAVSRADVRAYLLVPEGDGEEGGNGGGARSSRRRPNSREFSGDDGRFALSGLTDGDYEVTVQHQEYQPWSTVVTVKYLDPSPDIRVLVEEGSVISGRVFLDDGSQPVVDGEGVGGVAARGTIDRYVAVDGEGRYRIAGLPPGDYQLTYRAHRGQEQGATPTASTSVGDSDHREIDLRP